MKSLCNDICAAITQSKVTPILIYLQPSPPPHTIPLIPHHTKPRSRSPNGNDKRESISRDPKHDSSGSNTMITDKRDCPGSNPMITEYTAKDAPAVVRWDLNHDSSGSNTTITYEHNCSGFDPIITDYTTKGATTVITLDANSNTGRSQENRQSTNKNNENMVEAVNETKILCMWVTLWLEFLASNNACNATRKLLQDLLVQIQQSDTHVVFLLWYSSNNNSSAAPIERSADVYKDFQALQTHSPCMNPKQHTKHQPVYTSVFLNHPDDLTQLQKYISLWFKNGDRKLYKNFLQWKNTMEVAWLKYSTR